MPKIKTNRTAYKRVRVNAAGKVIRGRSNTSHNTGKKAAHKVRELRANKLLPKRSVDMFRRMIPHLGIS